MLSDNPSLEEFEERCPDQIIGIAPGEALRRPGDERNHAIGGDFDHEMGGGERKADEAGALAADSVENRICGVQSHRGVEVPVRRTATSGRGPSDRISMELPKQRLKSG